MKPSIPRIIFKSIKFSLYVVCITLLIVFLCAPTMFGAVIITPSLVAIVFVYGVLSLLIGLIYNSLKTYLTIKREG